MENLIILAVIALIVGLAVGYIRKEKKRGVKCIGCPNGCSCSGACGGCGIRCAVPGGNAENLLNGSQQPVNRAIHSERQEYKNE